MTRDSVHLFCRFQAHTDKEGPANKKLLCFYWPIASAAVGWLRMCLSSKLKPLTMHSNDEDILNAQHSMGDDCLHARGYLAAMKTFRPQVFCVHVAARGVMHVQACKSRLERQNIRTIKTTRQSESLVFLCTASFTCSHNQYAEQRNTLHIMSCKIRHQSQSAPHLTACWRQSRRGKSRQQACQR